MSEKNRLILAEMGANSSTSTSVTAWESQSRDGEPVTDLMENIFQALDRLNRPDSGCSGNEPSTSV